MKKKTSGEFGYKILTPIMRVLFRLYYNPKIVNKNLIPKEGAALVVCNHKHVYDQCLTIMATKRVIHYMAKKEYFDGKFAWFFKSVGCISVDRSKKDTEATSSALEVLNNGGVVGLFPEGTRNKTNTEILLPLKYGAVSMAQKTGAKIVPCIVTGDYKFRSKNLMVRYAEPFVIDEKADLTEQLEKLNNIFIELFNKNLEATNRTLEEELNSRCQDTKK